MVAQSTYLATEGRRGNRVGQVNEMTTRDQAVVQSAWRAHNYLRHQAVINQWPRLDEIADLLLEMRERLLVLLEEAENDAV